MLRKLFRLFGFRFKKASDVLKIRVNVDVLFFNADKVPDYASYMRLMGGRDALAWCNIQSAMVGHEFGHNLITDYGLNYIAGLINGVNTVYIQYNGVGSSSTAAASTDTDLLTPIGSRKAVTAGGAYVISNVCHIDTFYASADNNGTWREYIISHLSSGANATARYVAAGDFTKDISKSAVVAWTISLTNA